jgi:hypothetical protein
LPSRTVQGRAISLAIQIRLIERPLRKVATLRYLPLSLLMAMIPTQQTILIWLEKLQKTLKPVHSNKFSLI